MSVSYVNSGSPQASQLNALTSELDDILRVLFSNKSWLLYSYTNTGIPEGRRFYFGDAASRKIFPSSGEYDHATFTASAAAKTISDTDVAKHLAFVEEGPTWDLDGSLEAHKQTVNVDGTDYDLYLCQVDVIGNVMSRERHRRIHVAEIIIEGWDTGVDFDFDSAWNKYHFFRFHNLDNEARTINLPGGSSIIIPAFGVQAVRRSYKLGTTWDTTYRYLWKAQSGDQLIFNHLNEGSTANNVASIQCFHDWLDIITDGVNPFRRGAFIDPTVCWDGSSLLPQAISGSVRLAEYYHHIGDVLSIEDSAGTPVATRGSIASWSALEGAGSQGIKGTVSGNDMTIDAVAGRPTPIDAAGFGTTLLPSNIKTLPHTATAPGPSLFLEGFTVETATLDAAYDPGSGVVNVTKDYDQAVIGFGWFIDNVSFTAWDTLGDIGTLVAGDGGDEVAVIQDQAWKSDGWRLLLTGHVSYDLTTCYQLDLDSVWDAATFGSNSIVVPFGKDLFGRDSWMMTNRRQGRRISDWAENWHPDLEGGDGLDEGVDWNAARVAPSDSVVFKTEVPGTLAETLNLPVIQRADHADRLAANYATVGWYSSNRASLLAGTTSDDTESIIRIPILREHYNHVAQRLNSIVSIRPFLFEDVIWYGELSDGGWFSGGIPFAADYHAPVLSTGSRADDLGLTVYSLTRVTDIGPDQTNYFCKASEVADLADSLGFPYLMERLEAPQFQAGGSDRRFFSSLDFTDAWRQLGSRFLIANHVSIGSGRLWEPADWPQSGTTLVAPVFRHERIVKTASDLPSSWTLNTESKIVIAPRPVLNWDNDPIGTDTDGVTFKDIPDNAEVISSIDPITAGTIVFPSSEITGDTDTAALAVILDESLPDGREAFEVTLINRLFYRRS